MPDQEPNGVAPDIRCYSDKKVAEMLDCSTRTVQRLQAAGQLETWNLGKRGKRTSHRSIVAYLQGER